MIDMFSTACASLEYFVTVNNVTHAAFNDEEAAREYYSQIVDVTEVRHWTVELHYWDGKEFTNLETFRS